MRKSINVETVTSALINKERARMWGTKVTDLVQNYVASTTFKADWCKKLKEEIEFANANLELLSENDYNWLLEQQKSPTVDSTESKRSLSIDSPEFKEALASAPFVCKTHCESEEEDNLPDSPENHPAYIPSSKHTEIMDEFNKLPPYDSLASSTVKGPINKSKLTISSTESQKRLWVVQITKGKKVWYKTSSSFTDGYISSSINDAALYTTKTDAEYYAKFIKPSNKDLYKLPFPVKVTVKEVLCTESSSRTIELVKPVVEAVEMPDDEKFVLWSNGSLEFFVRIDSTGIRTTKNIDEATRYVSYKSASTAVKKTDKELPYRFSISTVKNVKPFVVPVEKPVKKVKEPKVKEEWVLYINGMNGVPWYYNGEINVPSYYSTTDLKDAVKFSSYGAATKAKCKLIKAGFITLDVANVEDCK